MTDATEDGNDYDNYYDSDDEDDDEEEELSKNKSNLSAYLWTSTAMLVGLATIGTNVLAYMVISVPLQIAACLCGSAVAVSVVATEPFLNGVDGKLKSATVQLD